MSAMEAELIDPALLGEVDLARAAAQQEAADEEVGEHVGAHVEGETAVTHLFEAAKPGYHGWSWAVTVASGGPDTDVTVSEVVLLPGPDALVAPEWVPWEHRVQAGDLGPGDLMPTAPDDPRLVPAYVQSDDPAVEDLAREVGLGRPRVMARPARLDAAARWQHSEFGPRSDMARSAPAHCGTCGFYLPLAGSLRAAFGTCGNEISPADGHVVHADYGCGAHSEAEVEQVSPVLVANLIYDDAQLDVAPLPKEEEPAEAPAAELSAPESTEAPAAAEEPTEPVAEEGEPAEPSAAESEPAPAEPVAEAAPASSVWTEPGADAPAAPQAPAEPEATAEPAHAEPQAPAEPEATAEPAPAEPEATAEPGGTTESAQAEQPAPASSVWTEPVSDEPAQPEAEPVQATEASSVWTEPVTDTPAEPEAEPEPAAEAASVWTEPAGDTPAEAPVEPEQPSDQAQADQAQADQAQADQAQAEQAEPEEAQAEDPAASNGAGNGASTDQPQLFDDDLHQNRRPWIGQHWFDE